MVPKQQFCFQNASPMITGRNNLFQFMVPLAPFSRPFSSKLPRFLQRAQPKCLDRFKEHLYVFLEYLRPSVHEEKVEAGRRLPRVVPIAKKKKSKILYRKVFQTHDRPIYTWKKEKAPFHTYTSALPSQSIEDNQGENRPSSYCIFTGMCSQ